MVVRTLMSIGLRGRDAARSMCLWRVEGNLHALPKPVEGALRQVLGEIRIDDGAERVYTLLDFFCHLG